MPVASRSIDVLLVTHNHEMSVYRALDSIAAQETPGYSVRILVADDRSTDRTRDSVSKWGKANPGIDLKFLGSHKPLGVHQNVLRAIASSSSEYVAFLEGSDFWLRPDKLYLQLELLAGHKEASLAVTRSLIDNADGAPTFISPIFATQGFAGILDGDLLAHENLFGQLSTCLYRGRDLRNAPSRVFEARLLDSPEDIRHSFSGPVGFVPILGTYHLEYSPDVSSKRTGPLEKETGTESDLLFQREIPNAGKFAPNYISHLQSLTHMAPKISIVLTSFNRGRHLQAAIDSALAQSFEDWELVILDDASTDDSWRLLLEQQDSRIRVFRTGSNLGGAAALNMAIQEARGAFIAVLHCDDTWQPDKLQRQMDIFEANPSLQAVFTEARFIDVNDASVPSDRLPFPRHIFQQDNRSRHEWLHDLMLHGNVLCHPSILIKKQVYIDTGLYDNRYRQLPDFKKWLELAAYGDFYVIKGYEGVHFRILGNGLNASSHTSVNVTRGLREYEQILSEFIEEVSLDDFSSTFSQYFERCSTKSLVDLEMEKALVWLRIDGPLKTLFRRIATSRIHRLLGSPGFEHRLRETYGVDCHFLYGLRGTSEEVGADSGTTLRPLEASTRELISEFRKRIQGRGVPALVRGALRLLRPER